MITSTLQKKEVLRIYNTALQAVRGEVCVNDYLLNAEFSRRLIDNEKIAILAIGKAAQSMAQGAYTVVKENFLRGLVISKQGHLSNSVLDPLFECYESSHPVPSEKSLIAGQKVIDFISGLPARTHLIVLISGGTSALVEKMKAGVSLQDLQKVNNWLLASGLAIEEINCIRQQLSSIKGGQLATFAGHLKVSNLLLSDVLSNDPRFIGSGLFVKNSLQPVLHSMPDWLKALLEQCSENKQDTEEPEIFTDLVATNTLLLNKIVALCDSKIKVFKSDSALFEDVELEAEKIVSQMTQGEKGIYIWGGEPVVKLPDDVGKGGRNQHLALLLADKIKGIQNMVILCIGTDGTDGNTDDAGALVDGETVSRGELEGYLVGECIHNYDSATFLHASGDVINTGPTGTNVMDVVIAYKWE